MKQNKYISIIANILIVAIVLANSGCATIIAGTAGKVHVKGEQPDAKVYYNGAYQGTAPCTVKVPKKDIKRGAVIEVRKEGYETQQVKLGKKVMVGWVIYNVAFSWTLIGPIIDIATGAMVRPTPEKVKYNLERKEGVAAVESN